jgi:hypothetical protein
MNNRTSLGDRLVAVEPLSSESRQKLEQELHAMFVKELSTPHRIFIGLVGIVSVASAALCAYLAITEARLPVIPRVGLTVGTLFGLAWAALVIRVLRRGTMDLKVDARHMAAMVWVFTVLMVVFFLMAGMSIPDRLLGLMMIAQSIPFLIGAGVYFLSFCIQQSDLNTREQFLRLELRIAELSEKR